MNRDDHPPVMTSEESSRRFRRALRAELDIRWGQRGAINAAIGHDAKYLNKVCLGEFPIKVDELLRALEFMAVDAGRFFASALGARVENDLLLADLERLGEIDSRFPAIEKATVQLELSEPPGPAPPIGDVEELVSAVVACNVREERRRLKTARRYCHPAFAAAYLKHLDALRYDDPKVARENARVVAVKLIPRLPGSQRERMALQLKAIGIFASGYRQKGSFATAACALRFALAFARRHRLPETIADLLQRAAYVLSDHGRYTDALELLGEAMVIFFDLDSHAGLGRVLVDRGTNFYCLGRYRDAVAVARRAQELLLGESRQISRNRLVAHQVLAHSFLKLGDLGAAEMETAQAVAESENAGRLYRGYLLWDHGVIGLERRMYDLAEKRLREASRFLARAGDRNQAMVTLDLTKALVAQSKNLEAVGMAVSTAEYLGTFRGNKVTAAAASDLMMTAVEGRLSLTGIDRVQANLEQAGQGMTRNPLQRTEPGRRTK